MTKLSSVCSFDFEEVKLKITGLGKSYMMFCLLSVFVWNEKNSWEPLNLYQSNCAAASKQALLIYDSGGLVLRQWIAALPWLVFIKRLHSLIMHHTRGRLVGCTDRVTLGLLCVCMCVCLCVAAIHIWRSPQNMVHSIGNQTKKVLYKICWRKQKSGTRGNIFSRAPRVCVWVPAIPFWKVFVDFQSFCRGESE